MIAGKRLINYLRISVTDRCNFRCVYCVPTEPFKVIPHNKIARYEEILRITKLAVEMGITKVRVTGGEPFARKGIFSFLKRLSAIEGLEDISITTNGSLLDHHLLRQLKEMGIKRLNFSLDTLDAGTFYAITKKNMFSKVWKNILTAGNLGFSPVKINTVILRGINDGEIEALAGLTRTYPFHVRFIEYMPMGDVYQTEGQPVLTDEIHRRIESAYGVLTPCPKSEIDGPARTYAIPDAPGRVGFISPISSHFCAECNRLRLTARGTLRPCLLNDYEKEILVPLRQGADDEALRQILTRSLARKPLDHALDENGKNRDPGKPLYLSHMTSIGG